ncbi:MAG: hypothetical protein JNK64_33845 [Myxococcales bacterium]|nr:hypothetical protein [Myxococcales bacterium]
MSGPAPLPAAALASLSPAAAKALTPGPGRMMAARGMLPLPRPGEVATVLYQIAATDPALAATAQATVDGLPDKVVEGALADAGVDGQVLDWLVPRVKKSPALVERLILAPAVADATIVALAERATAAQVDVIVANEQRLLRCPDIIAALYGNANARMSTVDRAVELAARAGVRVNGISAWDELARLVTSAPAGASSGADDAAFAQALAGVATVADASVISPDDRAGEEGVAIAASEDQAPAVDDKQVPIAKLGIPAKIRLATLGNAFARALLIRDPMKLVAVAAIKSPGVTDLEAAKYAGNHALCDDVIRFIASRRDWTRLYGVKKSLILNPKTPLTESTKFLIHMREREVRMIAQSKGIPSAVVAQARKLLQSRGSGK